MGGGTLPVPVGWTCAVCRSGRGAWRWSVPADTTEGGVDPSAFRPSSQRFGDASSAVISCLACGHSSLSEAIDAAAVTDAYAQAVDEVSIREEAGQVETARRALAGIERFVNPGPMVDVGCWTGSMLVAAFERGWTTLGIEPSEWASGRAAERGMEVENVEWDQADIAQGSRRLVTVCDVLEHLADPGAAVDRLGGWLEPGGALYVTVPDAGSRLARVMGRRWWSVLPMHLQYFTRASMTRLLTDRGFRVVQVGSHAKAFSARYYAERLGGYHDALERLAVGGVQRAGWADRLISPDFHDRMEVIAIAG